MNFTSDGQTAEKKERKEYITERGTGKIELMILYTLSVLNKLKGKQKERVEKHDRPIRNNNNNKFDDASNCQLMNIFCITMDNYFTLP